MISVLRFVNKKYNQTAISVLRSAKASHCRFSLSIPRDLSGRLVKSSDMVKVSAKRGRSEGLATKAVTHDANTTNPSSKKGLAKDLVTFCNYAWTPYHAVEEASRRLFEAGFQHISERDVWQIQRGGKYFFTRNFSTIVAFAVGEKYEPGNGFYMIGAHTDSPCLKLKPVTKSTKSGYLMVNIETYGGGLWYTWFDRDLGLAGRVLLRKPSESTSASPAIYSRLLKIDRPLLRIPMLAIHLQRDIHTNGFKPNLQTNFAPILATAVKSQLGLHKKGEEEAVASEPAPSNEAAKQSSSPSSPSPESVKHHSLLMEILSEELGVSPNDIVDFELNLCDVQPGVVGGAKSEFVFCGRLDNLAMSFVSLQALIDTCKSEGALSEETGVRAIALFDHEEVGSDSAQGAGGPVMRDTITRVAVALGSDGEGVVERTMRSSFLVSADMAHALHPNYADKHDPDHQPKLHEGLVLKHNTNQRYATNAVSAALFREVGRLRGISCQEFSVRNDMPCGSTIGPILASNLGCRTVDVGIPQLSMHSIREMCGTDDVDISYNHFVAFFEDFSKLDVSLDLDNLPPPDLRGTLADVPCNHVHGGSGQKLVDIPMTDK
ncbi:hypothetical protein CEUSTIGMA_g11613.t1 [Chlamydomonas eustigma]|uniref:aspartyl aminopeptidase n=1 Tax=Chlamydomonas eustigma TaxID=1157962 RepID=A0A250XMZ9_9CHLO|nr:hypothetical protein CEUSTIGMA_g11613.t1 [Chlamydomonas eustigma]|eukprot:GAX84190.1 hypothetical protein CEUSTIGMA_g11613.t1 [Chlamydomonas eustigma]